MKKTKLFSLMLVLLMLFCTLIIPSNAADIATDEHIDIYIENGDISEETKEKIIAYYTNGGEDDGVAICGLTCTLFGHNIETSTITAVTHNYRTTAPKCLQRRYKYEACTRCDYETSTLLGSIFVYCCS